MNHPYRPTGPIDFPKTNYEKNLDVLGAFHYVAGGLIALCSCFFFAQIVTGLAMTATPERAPWPSAGTVLTATGGAGLVLGWTVAGLVIGAGRCIRRRRARPFCLVIAGLSCLSVPFGTALGVVTLVLLTKPDVGALFDREAGAGDRGPPLVRPWLLVSAGVALIAGLCGLALSWRDEQRSHLKAAMQIAANRPSAPTRDSREDRSRAAFQVAPGPVPLSLPLLGPEGADADGYPTQYVDRAGLRSLLHARNFKSLNDYVGRLQDAFEANPRKEYWPIDAGEAFASAEPELNADLDIWVAASPASFAAHLARGSHSVGVMWAMRGGKVRSQTPDADFRAMSEWGRRAIDDLDEALKLRPHLVAAMRQEMRVALATSDSVRRDAMRDAALRVCPGCLQPRATYLHALTPRWGGSYELMRAFGGTSPLLANSRLRVLSGYEGLDRAEMLEDDQKFDEALASIELAVSAGEYWEYLAERASILRRLNRFDDALADLNRADAQRPLHPRILAARANVQRHREEFLSAGRDLLATLRIDPSNDEAKGELSYVLNGVLWKAQRLEADHDHGRALEAAELGIDLGPTDPQAHRVHGRIVLGDATTPERIAQLHEFVAAHPGDFRAVQQLDYALSLQNRFPEIVVLWDAFLALHPADGRGYMERSGTNHHLGKVVEARADAARACELGISEGCERAAAR